MEHTVGMSPHEHLRLGGAAEALLEAVSAISSDLDLRSVLTRLVEFVHDTTATLSAAQSAAS